MGSVEKLFDDVPALDDTNDQAPHTVALDGARLAEQLLAGLINIRTAAAALRYQAGEIALLRRSVALDAQP